MPFDLTVKNYRCFPDSNPARISVRPGFTALVGANNSGKSALLRLFYDFRGMLQQLAGTDGQLLHRFRGAPTSFNYPTDSVIDPTELFSAANVRDMTLEFEFPPATRTDAVLVGPEIKRLVVVVQRGTNQWRIDTFETQDGVRATDAGYQSPDQRLLNDGQGRPLADTAAFVKHIEPLTSTLYIAAFRNTINVGGTSRYFDIEAGAAFIGAWKNYKTGRIKAHREAAFKLTEDIRRIFGFDQLEINASDDPQSLTGFINGRSFRFDEVGSGISQFILVLANAAIHNRHTILIDEPESNLHPSLQVDFLTTLASYARFGVMFSTHSLGLAQRMTENIFSLRRLKEGESQIGPYTATPRLPEFLGELSFSGHRELGFNKVLLVEGPHDVTTVQQFLRAIQKDHEVVVLHLGGASMITPKRDQELAEVLKLSTNVFALIDSERIAHGQPLSPSRAGFRDLCKSLGITCHVLTRRAMENYFTDDAVKAVKGESHHALGEFEALGDAWAKSENWRIAREMAGTDLNALRGTDLRDFLLAL